MVHVTLIDAATTAKLGEADFPPEQLPESFAAPTTLHLAGGDWRVDRAEPATRAEYVATGALTIWMTRVVDPKAIVFSLPTIETLQPPLLERADGVWMHEDAWRQIELVSARFSREIDAELAAIRAVLADCAKGPGFTKLHVRERIPEPLAGTRITLAEIGLTARLEIALGPASGRGATVSGGFLFEDGDAAIYGREDAGRVVALGLARPAPSPRLVALAHTHDLVIVNWVIAERG